jgi:hypothetical protein
MAKRFKRSGSTSFYAFAKWKARCDAPRGFGSSRNLSRYRFSIRRPLNMSIFQYRKPVGEQRHRSQILVLRETLDRLEAEPEETRRISDLKRILAGRIAELEQTA